MSGETRNRPRGAAPGAGGRNANGTSRHRHDRRFREPFALTATEVETAIATADATQFARALDPYSFEHRDTEVTFRCPRCDRKQASATSRWRWRCDACDTSGAWLALRQLVAMDVEATVRLSEIIHGVKVSRPARDGA